MIKKYEETAKGKPPHTFRLTGRDGPPGSTMIPGAPAWLAKVKQSCPHELQIRVKK